MFIPRKLLSDKLFSHIFARCMVTAETTITTSTTKKKFNDGALKKWAIVSPLVDTKQLVISANTLTQILKN